MQVLPHVKEQDSHSVALQVYEQVPPHEFRQVSSVGWQGNVVGISRGPTVHPIL